jgi:hypothetical protein
VGIIEEQDNFFPVLYAGAQPGVHLADRVARGQRVVCQPRLLRELHKQILDTGDSVREIYDPRRRFLGLSKGFEEEGFPRPACSSDN